MLKQIYFITVMLLIYVPIGKSEKLTYIQFLEYFDTLKIFKRLSDISSKTKCGIHVSEFLNDLESDKHWAAVSK